MGTDLHAPLGQGRPPRSKKAPKNRRGILLALPAVGFLAALSVYALWQDDGLKQVASGAIQLQENGAGSSLGDETSVSATPSDRNEKNTNSGAHVEQMPTVDGGYVTKYTPRDRNGSVVVNAQRIGQDPRLAAQPNPDLIEETPLGSLPTIGPDGLRPMDQYGRPWSGARGTRVAIVISGLGLSQTGSQRAVQQLPPGVTLGFAASGNSLQRWMQEARRKGHEILLQIPMEPFDYPANDPGPSTLLTANPARENLDLLHQSMAKITNYTGILNYQGGRYLSDEKALRPVLQDLGRRGLLFLDDGTASISRTEAVAGATNLPHAFADVVLDGQLQKQAVLRKLDEMERIASRKGTAIGVAMAFDESIDAVKQWSEEAARRGIEIVGVSAIVRDNYRP